MEEIMLAQQYQHFQYMLPEKNTANRFLIFIALIDSYFTSFFLSENFNKFYTFSYSFFTIKQDTSGLFIFHLLFRSYLKGTI